MNERIKVKEVRLIGEDGTNHGIVLTSEALQMAEDADLDLDPTAEIGSELPPVEDEADVELGELPDDFDMGPESFDDEIVLNSKYDNEKRVYIILESVGKCVDGDFEFEYN